LQITPSKEQVHQVVQGGDGDHRQHGGAQGEDHSVFGVAAELIGKELLLGFEEPEEETSFEEDDELYLEDFVGFTATFEGSDASGEITDFEDSDWNPLFIIEIAGREVMVPAADDFIVEYSPSGRTVHFELPDGLLDLN
jgi:16S rRNA processing protein RimM